MTSEEKHFKYLIGFAMPVSETVESGSDFWSCQMAFPFVVKNFRPPLEGKW